MKTNIYKREDRAFVLRKEHVEKIWKLFREIGKPKIIIKCEDNIKREFEELKKFFEYENISSKEINNFRIMVGEEYDYLKKPKIPKSANIEFTKNSWDRTLIDIEASEQVTERLLGNLNDIFESTTPWYAKFTQMINSNFMIPIVMIPFFLLVPWGKLAVILKPLLAPIESIEIKKFIVIVLIACIGFLLFLLFKIFLKYFPMTCFAINNGLNRYNFKENIRWVIVGGFIVSFSASIFFKLSGI